MALTSAENLERFKLNPTGPAIGIDLGTTNSCVGYFVNNNVEIIATAAGKRTVPSYVFYNDNGGCIIGEQAIARLKTNPNHVVYDSKRMIGLNYDDNVVNRNKSFWTFTVTKSNNNRPIYDIDKNHQVLPEEVSSEILKELIKMAQDKIGTENIKSAVITVPVHFLVGQKDATIHAANLAGIEHVKLITEPTAAAFAYGFDHKRFDGYNLFVFDLGGGTCDVSIVKVEKGEFKVIGYAWDTQLGGRNYDNYLIQYFDQNQALRGFERDEIITKRKMRFREACEALKIAHPAKVSKTIDLDDAAPGTSDEDLTYKQFKEIVASLTRRCRKLCFDALEETKLKTDDIDEVLLVGGSSKMRVIKDMLKEVFPTKELREAINPDEVVAYGATLRAAQLLDPEKSKGFGIVDRNTPFPTKFGPDTYSTVYNNQTAMTYNISSVLSSEGLLKAALEAYKKAHGRPLVILPETIVTKVSEYPQKGEGILSNTKLPDAFQIFIELTDGNTMTLFVQNSTAVKDVKGMIQKKHGCPIDEQRLLFGTKQLDDSKTMVDYKIEKESTLHLISKLRGGFIDPVELDKLYNYDFTDKSYHRSQRLARGGKRYIRPGGSYRHAVKVLSKYNNDFWLTSSESGWAVFYHGLDPSNLQGIINEGFNRNFNRRDLFASRFNSNVMGFYGAPDPKTALEYALTFDYENRPYRMILQCRVDPAAIQFIPHCETRRGDYYRVEDEKKIRPYGICLFEDGALNNSQYITETSSNNDCTFL